MSSGEIGEIVFPASEAFRFCIESIRKRFTRALITALSIVLGIAFMVTLLTMAAILRVVGQEAGGVAIEAYQYWMAMIALLVCGVGIVNSMLMSVTERYQEIGTIKCLGATNTNVLLIFLIEAVLLGLLGGVIGAVVGWAAAVVIYTVQGFAVFSGNLLVLYLQYFVYAIVAALGLSVVAAAYPAYYAAKLNPVEALRYVV